MNDKRRWNRYRTVSVLLFFALALFAVGAVLRTRIGIFVQIYTENQTRKQAETYALLMSEKLSSELENLEYIAGELEASPDDLDEVIPRHFQEPGITQGLLGIDGETLYGESPDVSVFDGIQSSFRGNRAITWEEDQGLLFTCPVYHGPNIRYVLYRLCPTDSLERRFATGIYDDHGKLCVTTRDGHVIVPFYNGTEEDAAWYGSEDIRRRYASMHQEMEISVAATRSFATDRGMMLLFEAEIPGTDFLISGYVPKSVAAEGIESLTLLVTWVFGLLMLLVLIGAIYLTRVSIKVQESDELRRAKALAEEASRAKSDFLANMSHEIRTPINAVLGMNEMILRESDNDVITTYASNIRTAGNSLLGIINDILDFSRIEAGKIEIIPVEYSLPSTINDLVNMIRSRADDKGLQLVLDFDAGLPRGLYGDEVRIRQIITNLLTNAVKYTEKGSVTLGIHYEDAGDDPDSILLQVYIKDTGIGIRSEDIEKLYLEFQRIEEKRNRHIEGTGLGMSITKNLLEIMGSSLEVESEYGQGSTFRFAVRQGVTDRQPLGDYAASFRQQLASRKRYHERFTAPGARVLMVDDNEMNLMVFRSLIKKTLIQVDTALRGDEGIALTGETRYDIIFLDHMMPEKDGIETLQEIKADAGNPNIGTPVICLTANAIAGAREEYLAAGFDDYLTKPIDPDSLEDMLMAYLPEELIGSPGGEEDAADTASDPSAVPEELLPLRDQKLLDLTQGMKNSGSAEVYLATLKLYHESFDAKAQELDRFFAEEDLKSYAIKVHALKSSLRIIGAQELGEEAQGLENAGKSGDADHIRAHHAEFAARCRSLSESLAVLFNREDGEDDRPEADADLMDAVFEEIRGAAQDMDCGRIEDILAEMEAYRIPGDRRELFGQVKNAAEQLEYDIILSLL